MRKHEKISSHNYGSLRALMHASEQHWQASGRLPTLPRFEDILDDSKRTEWDTLIAGIDNNSLSKSKIKSKLSSFAEPMRQHAEEVTKFLLADGPSLLLTLQLIPGK